MLFLVSGASGVGKSTVRQLLTPCLGRSIEALELADLASTDHTDLPWRQRTAEAAATRAGALRSAGRHLLLSGDPVAPAEIIAAPSAPAVGGIAVCLLDAAPEAQTERLTRRGDPPELLAAHLGFAQWMREHADHPLPRLQVLTDGGWPAMRWHRLAVLASWPQLWRVHTIDTTTSTPQQVAAAVHDWLTRALVDPALVMHPEDWPETTGAPALSDAGDTLRAGGLSDADRPPSRPRPPTDDGDGEGDGTGCGTGCASGGPGPR